MEPRKLTARVAKRLEAIARAREQGITGWSMGQDAYEYELGRAVREYTDDAEFPLTHIFVEYYYIK